MPQSAPRPCSVPGCPAHAVERGRCEAHRQKPWERTARQVKRTTGRKLQRQRAELFAGEPCCRRCASIGRMRLATIRDHIVPLAEGGADDPGNLQPLCDECHDAKTAAEAKRGRGGGSNV